MIELKHQNIAIAAHDAGAANHILAWLRDKQLFGKNICLSLQGPAAKIFSKQNLDYPNVAIKDAITQASCLLSGTGWKDYEFDAREAAFSAGLETIATIDHWTNYRERFTRKGKTLPPDQIWVVDQDAYWLAKQTFPETPVVLQKNCYLKQQIDIINQYSKEGGSSNTILYVMEPFRERWAEASLPGEFEAFDYFIRHIDALDVAHNIKIVIKPHPSDSPKKYDHLPKQYDHYDITIDSVRSLHEQIAGAKYIVGCQTYAMVVALTAGKTVVSSLPPSAPACTLPHKNIIQLANLVA